uniref:GH18 domain-containing protein n=1 Tax=Ursus americanus TaxID=9643 RepID=A0A452RHI9_URSAM
MLSTLSNRERFIDSVISLLRKHKFDGLDLFFLYPGLRGSPKSDRWTFLLLIEVRPSLAAPGSGNDSAFILAGHLLWWLKATSLRSLGAGPVSDSRGSVNEAFLADTFCP